MHSEQQSGAISAVNWHRSLAQAIREPGELLKRLSLPADLLPAAQQASQLFPLLVPESFLKRMEPGNAADPLLRQVLPLGEEHQAIPGFAADAVDDARFRFAHGLLQKYQGRALLIATGSCAVHCRYCFRRHYPYGEEPRRLDDWQPALDAIGEDSSLEEVLLSGGDPLMLTDQRLSDLIARLEAIPHLRRLRIHTRLPIVLPDRVTPELLDRLLDCRLKVVFVVHANHAAELVDDCAEALRKLVAAPLTVLNQAVLLRSVNDSLEAQCDLSSALIDLGVMPYYLHQLDRVSGAAHFEVPVETGRALIQEMRRRLPGYAIPRYVQEIPGEAHKTVLE
ncbi:MAG: EF-P beta-lysylation protein EpmB [Planctomycetes bacterium]|nr:EF-P beta-lysylation protein EpmB [Planctomycetota bacterium]